MRLTIIFSPSSSADRLSRCEERDTSNGPIRVPDDKNDRTFGFRNVLRSDRAGKKKKSSTPSRDASARAIGGTPHDNHGAYCVRAHGEYRARALAAAGGASRGGYLIDDSCTHMTRAKSQTWPTPLF